MTYGNLCILLKKKGNMKHETGNTLIAHELSGFTCTRSLTMNSKFSIPHMAASCGIENFEFIVSELMQINPDNSLAECVNL